MRGGEQFGISLAALFRLTYFLYDPYLELLCSLAQGVEEEGGISGDALPPAQHELVLTVHCSYPDDA